MNGKQGDHPLTDILKLNHPRYSQKADDLIREIARYGGLKELEKSFDLFSPPPLQEFESKLEAMRDHWKAQAKACGWEI